MSIDLTPPPPSRPGLARRSQLGRLIREVEQTRLPSQSGLARTTRGSLFSRGPVGVPVQQYNGPFALRASGQYVYVGRGWVWAGDRAQWDFPSISDPAQQDYIDCSGLGNGWYVAYLDISVDLDDGFFTENSYPILAHWSFGHIDGPTPTLAASIQAGDRCRQVLGLFCVADGLVISVKQHQYGNIYVPVKYLFSQSGSEEYRFVCSWANGRPNIVERTFVTSVPGIADVGTSNNYDDPDTEAYPELDPKFGGDPLD
jgi:hypothetical protein